MHTVTASWVPRNNTITTVYQPSLFNLRCFNDKLQHSVELSVDNETFMAQLGGLFSSAAYYICCVSAVYGSYVADETCTLLRFPNEETFESDSLASTAKRTNIVSGVLGFIIAVLFTVLAICGGVLLFLLRSRPLIRKNT